MADAKTCAIKISNIVNDIIKSINGYPSLFSSKLDCDSLHERITDENAEQSRRIAWDHITHLINWISENARADKIIDVLEQTKLISRLNCIDEFYEIGGDYYCEIVFKFIESNYDCAPFWDSETRMVSAQTKEELARRVSYAVHERRFEYLNIHPSDMSCLDTSFKYEIGNIKQSIDLGEYDLPLLVSPYSIKIDYMMRHHRERQNVIAAKEKEKRRKMFEQLKDEFGD